jgi:hypothetical protein
MRVRDLLGVLFEDARLVELFATRGRPAYAPGRLALVSVLRFAEGLTDRQTADAVRGRIDWKYLLGLDLEDAGFDASVLSEFRARLAETGSAQQLIFEALLDRLAEADGICTAWNSSGRPCAPRSRRSPPRIPGGCGTGLPRSGTSGTVHAWISAGCRPLQRSARC